MAEAARYTFGIGRGDLHPRGRPAFVADVLNVPRLRAAQRPLVEQGRVVRHHHRTFEAGYRCHRNDVVRHCPGAASRLPAEQARVGPRMAQRRQMPGGRRTLGKRSVLTPGGQRFARLVRRPRRHAHVGPRPKRPVHPREQGALAARPRRCGRCTVTTSMRSQSRSLTPAARSSAASGSAAKNPTSAPSRHRIGSFHRAPDAAAGAAGDLPGLPAPQHGREAAEAQQFVPAAGRTPRRAFGHRGEPRAHTFPVRPGQFRAGRALPPLLAFHDGSGLVPTHQPTLDETVEQIEVFTGRQPSARTQPLVEPADRGERLPGDEQVGASPDDACGPLVQPPRLGVVDQRESGGIAAAARQRHATGDERHVGPGCGSGQRVGPARLDQQVVVEEHDMVGRRFPPAAVARPRRSRDVFTQVMRPLSARDLLHFRRA